MKNKSKNFQQNESIKFRISGKDNKVLRLAHYRAMFMNPEDVSGFDHEQCAFIIDSNIQPLDSSSLNPFQKWCESLGEVKVEVVN